MQIEKMDDVTRAAVRQHYAEAARAVLAGEGCCGESCCGSDKSVVTAGHYTSDEVSGLPETLLQASLGCGNPTALIDLQPGQVVLDLGSGGGIDVLLSARRVGPTGHAYGLDMTDEMLALAERHKAEAGATNATFLRGQMEAIPLPDASVDVVISNCVINLSTDKAAVLRETFRVLRPGGRFAVSDIVVRGPIPAALRHNLESWAGCLAGALEEDEYRRLLSTAGFMDIELEVTRVYDLADLAADSGACCSADTREMSPAALESADLDAAQGRFVSAFVRATKPSDL